MRVALYARYSSDQQRAASIADQLRICREYVARQGWVVVAEHSDAAISGASLNRPGIQALMLAAADRRFDVVLAESLDRFSRDQEDTAGLFKRLTFAGVKVVTLSEGVIGHLHVGLKGTMNALFLLDLADKTRRGLRGRVEAGFSGGGRSYGYRVSQTGERSIDEREAATVSRIFAAYVSGVSPKAIAQQLNAEGARGPQSQPWGPTTIHGHAKRGTGILNNELYVGRIVWNKQRYVKDPDSGRRLARPNAREDWVTVDVPELRILPDELWEAAKRRQTETRHVIEGANLWRARRHPYLFSGLMHCAECGYGYVSYVRNRLACTGYRERGVCSNRLTIRRSDVEQRVLSAIEQRALSAPLFEVFCDEVRMAVAEYGQHHRTRAAADARERQAIDRDIARIITAVKDGFSSSSLRDELHALEARKASLVVGVAPKMRRLQIPSDLAEQCRLEFRALRQACERHDIDEPTREAVRRMVNDVRLKPEGDTLGIRVTGLWSALLGQAGEEITAVGIDGCGGSQPTIPTSHYDVAA